MCTGDNVQDVCIRDEKSGIGNSGWHVLREGMLHSLRMLCGWCHVSESPSLLAHSHGVEIPSP